MRKIINMTGILALCDDGTVWQLQTRDRREGGMIQKSKIIIPDTYKDKEEDKVNWEEKQKKYYEERLRDEFAIAALPFTQSLAWRECQGIGDFSEEKAAHYAYLQANAMMEARKK